MVARVLFPVLTCGGTRSRPQHRATLRWTGVLSHFVGASSGRWLVLALPCCTLSLMRQHSPLWSPALLFPLKGCRPRV
jgi:hypothetical protein